MAATVLVRRNPVCSEPAIRSLQSKLLLVHRGKTSLVLIALNICTLGNRIAGAVTSWPVSEYDAKPGSPPAAPGDQRPGGTRGPHYCTVRLRVVVRAVVPEVAVTVTT